ncbi:MAG: hypothetical protein Tsb009_34410 [Planctomycetaceae bacterium]
MKFNATFLQHNSTCNLSVLFLTVTLGCFLVPSPCDAEEKLLPANRSIQSVIDHYIAANIRENKIVPAPQASAANLIRRTTLDLAGRVPTPAEVREFVTSSDPKKREKLVDRLLNSPDFNLHQRNQLDDMLLAGLKNDNEWREYLLTAVAENRPWDQMFREMMIGREDNPKEKPALAFLKARARNLDDMVNDTSKLFFGVSINCAKCHDHPLVDDWKQDHFYGLMTFFARTYLTKSQKLGEKSTATVKFTTTAGKQKQAKLMFLTSTVVEEPPLKKTKEELKKEDAEIRRQMKDAKAPAPKPPAFSPRAKLVETALKPGQNHFFSKSIVNRLWARLMGQGLVDPLDQMHSGNPASHPELLAWLARDLVAHKYDLKRVIRGIVLSEPYARSSRWSGKGDPPASHHFAVAIPRPLTPQQYALSLMIATSNPNDLEQKMKSADWKKHREALEKSAAGFANQLERPGENFQVSVDEALLFSNNTRIERDYLRDSRDRIVGWLKSIDNDKTLIQTAFRTVLSRDAEAEELAAFQKYINKRKDRRLDGIRQVVWALITSPELRFNY